jgi:hypothetical protein
MGPKHTIFLARRRSIVGFRVFSNMRKNRTPGPISGRSNARVKCQGQTSKGKECGSAFSILSPVHLDEEVERLRNANGVLDGPACGACGVRFLDDPNQFALDGVHERTKDHDGKAIRKKKTPTSLRVLHKPCRGKKGARFSVSLPHAGQKSTADNLRILGAILNSAGIVDIQRMIGTATTGKKIGMSRIYDRIAWLEEVFLAYPRALEALFFCFSIWPWMTQMIDQPEENLDPKSVFDELVSLFISAKNKRQVIMVTHNANLVINTDADQVIVAEAGPHSSTGLPQITYRGGGLENAEVPPRGMRQLLAGVFF